MYIKRGSSYHLEEQIWYYLDIVVNQIWKKVQD